MSHRFGTLAPPELAAALPEWKRACFEHWIWDHDPVSLWRVPPGKQLRLLALTLLLDDDWRTRRDHLAWTTAEAFRRVASFPGQLGY